MQDTDLNTLAHARTGEAITERRLNGDAEQRIGQTVEDANWRGRFRRPVSETLETSYATHTSSNYVINLCEAILRKAEKPRTTQEAAETERVPEGLGPAVEAMRDEVEVERAQQEVEL
ncbi:hypothetical protein FKW77_000532 [Venturia effusa]|uniref:Uncharacterized protein n=1 Tax=Venturia effusa TaxID=50376 RepID=A0A517L0N5_9PEZI|nr:hypothetical protein FKW77_000532 [Venturia effusa]